MTRSIRTTGWSRRGGRWALASAAAMLSITAAAVAAGPPGGASAGPFEINITHGLGAGEPELAIEPVHRTLVISFDYSNAPDGGR